MELRGIKNFFFMNKNLVYFSLFLINLPLIGDIYDSFYFNHIRKKVDAAQLRIVIESNNLCNLRCLMCPYKDMKRKKEVLDMSTFRKIVDQADELGCEEMILNQYNEPFTDKYIFERFKYIRNYKEMKILLYSNATLLNKEMRDKILENPPDVLRFSFDGFSKEVYESIRKGASFEEARGNIHKLFEERNNKNQKLPRIEVYFTVLEKNKYEIKSFLRYWKNKADFATIYPGDSRESSELSVFDYKNKKSYPCFNPKEIIVLSSGKVSLCCVDYEGKIILGDLKKQSLKEVLNSPERKKIFESQMNRKNSVSLCKECSKFYIDTAFSWWA